MKNKNKVIEDRISRIENNNLKVKDYIDESKIICECGSCKREIVDNYRNLNYKKFECNFCKLSKKSELIKDGVVKITEINGSKIGLVCYKGHKYTQDRRNLLKGKKCKKCYLESKVFEKDEVINKIFKVHGDHFIYNMENFKSLHSKIEIECRKGHKFIQKVSNHLQGKGCPRCRESFGERMIDKFLTENKIEFIRQKKFSECKFEGLLPFDFYIPLKNIAIEFDGEQHFYPITVFGGEKEFIKTKIKDQIKNTFCEQNNIKLIRIAYYENISSKLIQCIQEYVIL